MTNAKRQAEVMAAAAGGRLGDLVELSTQAPASIGRISPATWPYANAGRLGSDSGVPRGSVRKRFCDGPLAICARPVRLSLDCGACSVEISMRPCTSPVAVNAREWHASRSRAFR